MIKSYHKLQRWWDWIVCWALRVKTSPGEKDSGKYVLILQVQSLLGEPTYIIGEHTTYNKKKQVYQPRTKVILSNNIPINGFQILPVG